MHKLLGTSYSRSKIIIKTTMLFFGPDAISCLRVQPLKSIAYVCRIKTSPLENIKTNFPSRPTVYNFADCNWR